MFLRIWVKELYLNFFLILQKKKTIEIRFHLIDYKQLSEKLDWKKDWEK